MTTIGDPKRFAIIYEIDEPRDNEWMFGHLWYVVDGDEVGDRTERTSLVTAIGGLEHVLLKSGARSGEELLGESAGNAFKKIKDALFEDDARSLEEIRTDGRYYWRFVAIPAGVDTFDTWQAYLIEGNERARLIWSRDPHEMPPREMWLLPGEFDSVVRSAKNRIRGELARDAADPP